MGKNRNSNKIIGKFRWTERKEQAAILLAADELTDEQIAIDLECPADLVEWLRHHQDDGL